MLGALCDPHTILGGGHCRRSPTAAKGTIAPPGGGKAITQRDLKHDSTAMAGRSHRRTLGMREAV
ncbi:hypothetical protein GCM10007385_25260 [Tateyamaria omphalii]|nr:hypothetical protein GCM10007385_25260 [Tateyamaria omphalii]